MSILITGGGTRVPIDDVRYIGNHATGSFPCKIVRAYLKQNYSVTYIGAKHGEKPFEVSIDYHSETSKESAMREFEGRLNEKIHAYRNFYYQYLYSTYDEYKDLVYQSCQQSWDTIFLGAAVSDYICDKVDGKISSQSNLEIKLKPAHKIISTIRHKQPGAKLIGFKLLYDVGEKSLIEAAEKSIEHNGCDGIVANDYWKIQQGRPEILFVTKKGVTKINTSDHMAEDLVCLVNKMPSP